MSSAVEPYVSTDISFDQRWIERIILNLGDTFHIRIIWNQDTAILTGAFALAGGLVGGYAGGRMGAAFGAGICGATGFGLSTMISLRQIWASVKEKLEELIYIVFNCLRRIDPVDYVRAYDVLMACRQSRQELVLAILDFIAHKLGCVVISNITAP